MAKERDVIKALESNLFLTTGELYSIAGRYPLIRLVSNGKIKCIIADKHYYFLEKHKDKLPAWLKKDKLAEGITIAKFDINNVHLTNCHDLNNIDISLFDIKLDISNDLLEKDGLYTKKRFTEEELKRKRESCKRYYNKRYWEDEEFRERVKARGREYWKTQQRFKQQAIMEIFQKFQKKGSFFYNNLLLQLE